MSYDVGRAAAIQDAYTVAIRAFLERYRGDRPTVVLLPGGMGSQLDRSSGPYLGGPIAFPFFEPVWIDFGLIFDHDALTLEIDDQDRDIDGHIIVPNGPVRWLVGAYDGARAWFEDQGYNFVVFGYDWRRPIAEAAGYLEFFLKRLALAISEREHPTPAPPTLLCHSQGGLVAKVFLHRVVDVASWVDRVITVATPFYGTATHMQRYFGGEAMLNILHGAERVAHIVSTLPGPYILMPLDQATFAADGARIGLADYPVVDAATGQVADPYDPALADRYPGWVKRRLIDQARQIRRTIVHPLPDPVIGRVFHLWSALDRGTATSFRWKPLPADFDPADRAAMPVRKAGSDGGGDGTVPAWSARLAQTGARNLYELRKARVHGELMDHEETLRAMTEIIETGTAPTAAVPGPNRLYGPAGVRGDEREAGAFLDDVAQGRAGRDDPRAYDVKIWRGLYRGIKR